MPAHLAKRITLLLLNQANLLSNGRSNEAIGFRFLIFFGFPTNLHALWDVYLPAGFIYDWREYAGEQAALISDTEHRQWLDSSLAEWAQESHRLAHSHAYPVQPNLGEDYYRRNREIVELRLRQGGVRLAGIINKQLSVE